MGKGGRFVCVFTPMLFSIVSLLLLVLVGFGSTPKRGDYFNNIYFFRANTSDIKADATNVDVPDFISQYLNLNNTPGSNKPVVKDFYHVGLWNYCAGDLRHDQTYDKGNPSKTDDVTECSKRQNQYWFNPVEAWGLNGTEADQLFSKQLRDGLKAYQAVSKWMFISYVVAVIATAVEILIGFFAFATRLGSVATTIASTVSSLFIIAFALTATALYATLTTTFNLALKKYNIHASLGYHMFLLVWLAVLFSWAGGLFWLFSSCCCSGRSDRIKGYKNGGGNTKGLEAQRTPYNYQRVESPFLGKSGNQRPSPSHQGSQLGVPMQSMGPRSTAYEPFRHEQT